MVSGAPSFTDLASDEMNDLSKVLDALDAFNTKWEGIIAERRATEDPRIAVLRAENVRLAHALKVTEDGLRWAHKKTEAACEQRNASDARADKAESERDEWRLNWNIAHEQFAEDVISFNAKIAAAEAERDALKAERERAYVSGLETGRMEAVIVEAERDALKAELEGIADWINRHVPAGTPRATAMLTRLRSITRDRQ